MMYCGECGSKMSKHDHGAWKICCNGIGYWWTEKPLYKDLWFGEPQEHEGHWLYKTAKWPKLLIATLPQYGE